MLVTILLVPETTGEVWEGNGSMLLSIPKSTQLQPKSTTTA